MLLVVGAGLGNESGLLSSEGIIAPTNVTYIFMDADYGELRQ